MCEDRIEAAFDQKGIVAADYDLEKKTIHVVYKTKKWDEERLHKLATAVGHDTDKYKATDEVYANMHGCCKYRDPKPQVETRPRRTADANGNWLASWRWRVGCGQCSGPSRPCGVFAPEDHSGNHVCRGAHVGKESFDPLPGATVMWKGGGRHGDGRVWVFSTRCPAQQIPTRLRVSMVGYQTVDVLFNGETSWTFRLSQGCCCNRRMWCLRSVLRACRCLTP